MSRALNWDAAKRRDQTRRAPLNQRPTKAQLSYIAALWSKVYGRDPVIKPDTRSNASLLIDQLKKELARKR